MKKITTYFLGLFCFGLISGSCQAPSSQSNEKKAVIGSSWQNQMEATLPLLGHRNWILVVDKAYPAPSSANVTIINTGQNLSEVAKQLDSLLKIQDHIQPIVYQDEELAHIDEQLVPGMDAFRKEVGAIFGSDIRVIPHVSVFKKIDDASKLFNIVILKTASVLPYTSLFIELDCKYWNADKEQELRHRILKNRNK
ncbi:hypothetical protein [Sphingobacterium sp. BIGb0165]|uniref:hypothetical protein n=1 Tax=Sphingobacterium sp. BIGb0165 TaxID=2940615 RepID=UPI002168CFB6|nr:hypothetical protein [Sphingobacterium sp. BIGb0165]MCS4225813.1 L-fucose mutarotase/ribose pyranase (RbsD/FucU family) [Sphingobacterium sp. BIGb0165]